MSLYRTYRPQTFADVVGQDHIVTTLERAVEQDKIAHAYLFAGSRGTGKTSVARILAKAIMINGLEDEALCQQIVKGVEEGSIVDLLEIDAASNRGIDDVRDLIEKIQFSPVVARAKVYIIDEVHMLTKEAFNALLKTLEEPPAYAFFILATTELTKIPVTIQSRCQCFPFRHIREEDIVRRLQYIADQERIEVEREALRAIARHVEGGMRDAISLLDQLRALPKISTDDVQQRIGSTGHEYIEHVFAALDERNSEELLTYIRKIEENGIPFDVFLRQLLSAVRTQLHAAVEAGQPTAGLVHMLDTLLDAIRDVRIAPLPALVLESALLSLCQADESATLPALANKAEPDKKSATKAPAADSSQPASDASTPAKEKPSTAEQPKTDQPADDAQSSETTKDAIVEAKEVSLENLQAAWPTVVKETEPAAVRMSLKDGRLQSVDGNSVIVSFSSAFHRDKVRDTEASRTIEAVMERIFKQSLRLECEIDANGSATATKEEMVNLADAASEIF